MVLEWRASPDRASGVGTPPGRPGGQYNVINRHRPGLARVSAAKLPVQIEANIANQAIPNFPDVGFDDRVLSVIVRSGQWQFCSALAHS